MGNYTLNVMAPLHLASYAAGNFKVGDREPTLYDPKGDREAFERELWDAAALGVDAVSVDVWWGMLQPVERGNFIWDYFDGIFESVAKVNESLSRPLQVVPILSFHQCGGNVGDAFFIPIPMWLWEAVRESAESSNTFPVRTVDITYRSETGNPSSEYIGHWADEYVAPLYLEVMAALKEHLETKKHRGIVAKDLVQEIIVGVGPSGELRYPSYNVHDWGDYPLWGPMQCSGPLAEASFSKFQTENGVAVDKVLKLADLLAASTTGTIRSLDIFGGRLHALSEDYRQLFRWYSGSLYDHGARILGLAANVFASWNCPIGFKIPGVHWRACAADANYRLQAEAYAVSPKEDYPRIPEMASGLIPSDLSYDPEDTSGFPKQYLQGLRRLLSQLPARESGYVLHFTCLEKIDKNTRADGYSIAGTLASWMAMTVRELRTEAIGRQLKIKGENALKLAPDDLSGWNQFLDNLHSPAYAEYAGITVLRISDLLRSPEKVRQRFKALREKKG